MKGYKKLLALSAFIVIAFPSLGQTKLTLETFWSNYSIRNYGVDEGIFSQQVYKIHKDKKGFYWIVSNGELLRFNGVIFKAFDKGNIGGTLYDLVGDEIWTIERDQEIFADFKIDSKMEKGTTISLSVMMGN